MVTAALVVVILLGVLYFLRRSAPGASSFAATRVEVTTTLEEDVLVIRVKNHNREMVSDVPVLLHATALLYKYPEPVLAALVSVHCLVHPAQLYERLTLRFTDPKWGRATLCAQAINYRTAGEGHPARSARMALQPRFPLRSDTELTVQRVLPKEELTIRLFVSVPAPSIF